jgi:hypothetical protein
MFMGFLTAAVAVSAIASAASPQRPPIKLSVSDLEREPLRWLSAKVEVCGVEKTYPELRLLTEEKDGVSFGIYLSADNKLLRKEGQKSCYDGIWHRHDGRTREQVLREGAGTVSHGHNPEYVLSSD